MKSLILASLFISSNAFADFSTSDKDMSANSSSSVEQQKAINSSTQKAESFDKIRELACKNRELIIIKHASKMP